ncbi:MAG: glutamyl-tRNA reductase [Planctomycetota bacterium]|jgi:glutamyl-tRNA reductase
MSRVLCAGLNHRTAKLELREQLSVALKDLPDHLARLRAHDQVLEAAVVSTCNRVEVYAAVEGGAELDPVALLGGFAGPEAAGALPQVCYRHENREAARHLFRVAAGLDSLVVGETQILGQVREAYGVAAAAGTTGRRLNPLFQQALACARKVHAQTDLGAGRVSVAGVAVDLAEKVFGELAGVTVLLIGTGDTGRLAMRHLQDAGAGRLLVASRSPERAAEVAAAVGGEAVLDAAGGSGNDAPLVRADLVVTATGDVDGGGPLIDAATLRDALRRRKQRPVLVVDLGVPRNVDPAAGNLDNCFYYDIDALQTVVNRNLKARASEVAGVESDVAAAVDAFWRLHGEPDVDATLAALNRTLTEAGRDEVEALLGKLDGLSPEQREAVSQLGRRLVNRLLHRPLDEIRKAAANGGAAELTAAVRRLFGLPETEEPPPAP